jgi:hypothetical protein
MYKISIHQPNIKNKWSTHEIIAVLAKNIIFVMVCGKKMVTILPIKGCVTHYNMSVTGT